MQSDNKKCKTCKYSTQDDFHHYNTLKIGFRICNVFNAFLCNVSCRQLLVLMIYKLHMKYRKLAIMLQECIPLSPLVSDR
ncbi:hypothetical protein FKM82_012482 [Ascaphus truei]